MPLLAVKSMQTTMAICIPADKKSVKSYLIVCLKFSNRTIPLSCPFLVRESLLLP